MSQSTSALPEVEFNALYALYNATHGAHWHYSGNPWNFSQPYPDPCGQQWQGVNCTTLCNSSTCTNHVTRLDLEELYMYGTLPEEIGDLSALRLFKISESYDLSGSIPPSVGNLTQLRTLSFTYTSLTGSLPSSISNLKSLQMLELVSGALSGTLPVELYELTNLSTISIADMIFHGPLSSRIDQLQSLTVLEVMNCDLSGTIPLEIQNLSSLTLIDLSDNALSGTIPPMLAYNNHALNELSLYSNHLTGPMPSKWNNTRNLTALNLFVNLLNGTIPVEIFSLSNLLSLDIGTNQLTGTLSSSVGNLTNLVELVVHDNELRGTLPSSISTLTELIRLQLDTNPFTGSIPGSLGDIVPLSYLELQNCFLTGSIPENIGQLANLIYLDLTDNLLTGTVPAQLYHLSKLQEIMVSSNFLTGTIANDIGNATAMFYLLLDKNMFYGPIPTSLSELTRLYHLSVGYNAFSGEFNVAVAQMKRMAMLQLESNLFSGSLSFMPYRANQLQVLNISVNSFFGNISFLSFMSRAATIDVAQNLISGSVPNIMSLKSMIYFFAQINLLEGSIKDLFVKGVNPSLQNIDISSNLLTGPLPDPIPVGKEVLESFSVIQNCFTGTIPESFCNQTSLQVLALDGLSTAKACRRSTLSSLLPQVHSYTLGNHAIHGSIPKCLFSMPKLRTLHLSGNGLEGSIPVEEEQELGASLSDLSLSHNQLTGSLPPPLRGGSRWVNLDVSYNKLKGELQLESGGESGDASAWTNSSSTSNSNSDSDSSAGSSSGFSANASIYLNINRLSGRIPGFYYDIGRAEGELNMLEGNMFACPETGLSSDVPSADPYRLQYGCGSDNLNSALLTWAGLVFSLISTVVIVYLMSKERMRLLNRRENPTISLKRAEKGGMEGLELGVIEESVHENQEAHEDDEKGRLKREHSCMISQFCTGIVFAVREISQWRKKLVRWHRDEVSNASYKVSQDKRIDSQQSDHRFRNWLGSLVSALPVCTPGSNSRVKREERNHPGEHDYEHGEAKLIDCLLKNADFEYAVKSIYDAGLLLHNIRRYVFWLMIYMVCVGGPVYGSLTAFYGSYDYEYAWTISAAYLSGVGAGCVLTVFFMALIGIALSAGGLFETQAYPTRKADDGKNVQVLPKENVRLASLRVCDNGDEELVSSTPTWEIVDETTSKSEPDGFLKNTLDWRAVLLVKFCIAVVNISIVLVVNGFYVFIYFQIERSEAMMLSVALSLFKVYWSMLVQLGIVHLLQPLQQQRKTNEKAGGLHEENVGFMSSLMLFNTIVAPCLATMIASSDCFYYVFASPKTIKASYHFEACTDSLSLGCQATYLATHSFDFAPPFSYTYQCSSALLVDYAYVFAYKYVLIGIFYPVFVMSVVLYGEWIRSGRETTDEKGKSLYGLELFLPLLWKTVEAKQRSEGSEVAQGKGDDDVDTRSMKLGEMGKSTHNPMFSASPTVGMEAEKRDGDDGSGAPTTSTQRTALPSSLSISPSYFSSGDYVVRVTMMLGCLLTFGAVLPYLAILIAFSIALNTYLTQVGWLRVLEKSLMNYKTKMEEKEIDVGKKGAGGGDRVADEDGMEIVENITLYEMKEDGKMGEGIEMKNTAAPKTTSLTALAAKSQEQMEEEANGVKEALLEIGSECHRMRRTFSRATQPLFVLLLFFYACYLFDTPGDEAGAWVGLYFVLAWFSVWVALSGVAFIWKLFCLGKDREDESGVCVWLKDYVSCKRTLQAKDGTRS